MRWFRRQPKGPEQPRGVRIECEDGTVVRCGVVRDPSGDSGGNVHWIAHPLKPYVLKAGDKISIDLLPANASMSFSLPAERSRE